MPIRGRVVKRRWLFYSCRRSWTARHNGTSCACMSTCDYDNQVMVAWPSRILSTKMFSFEFCSIFFLTCHLEISNSNRNLFSTDQVGRKSQNKFNNHNVKQVDTIHKIYKDKNELLLVLIHLDTWIKVILIYLQPYGEVIFIYKYSRLSESRLFTYWIVDLHENVNFWFYRRNLSISLIVSLQLTWHRKKEIVVIIVMTKKIFPSRSQKINK